MGTYIVRRLFVALIVLAIVTVISFLIVRLTPGTAYPWADLGPKVSKESVELYKKKFHLDDPLHLQFGYVIRDLFTGKLVSNKDEQPVLKKIVERLPATISLNAVSILLAYAFGVPFGVWAAKHRGKAPDTFGTVVAFALIALPGFWISYLMIIALVKYAALPILGLATFGADYSNSFQVWLDRLWHLLVPASVMASGAIAVQSRYIRATVSEALSEDYIRTARAKGLSGEAVLYKHALRNSIRPLVTGFGLLLPALLGGSVIIESIFAYPGLGRLGYEAVLERDYPMLVTINFITAILVLVGNLVADLLYAWVDPRVRLS